MEALLSIAFALMAGLMMTRLLKKTNLPDVTAYLITGVLIGPFFLGRLGLSGIGFSTYDEISKLVFISDVALGFIAFSIGNEFRLEDLKKFGKQATVIGVFQAITATLLVDAVLISTHFIFPDIISLPAAITLGAIASATAPAATLMVVRQYKAKGELTSLLLPIVALDDAVGLVVFAISFGIARSITTGSVNLFGVLINPLVEIIASLLLGAIAAGLLTLLERLFNSNRNRLSMTIAFIFLTVALSMLKINIGPVTIGFSSLLVCMMLGTVFCNICPLSEDIMANSDRWSTPIMVLFFVLSGANLEIEVFGSVQVVIVGVIYIITRSLGKYFGARYSSRLSGCSKNVVDYLGVTLLPQAGVALGMCILAMELGGTDGPFIRNIVLFSVLIYELFGPLATKWALTKAGDIQPQSDDVRNRRKQKLEKAPDKPYAKVFNKK
ncbi:MAG: cation:proton antiporter [Lachnospiraceae bacterium]|nr:cation:proton antiporter [Candidatus Minthocola equi]